MTRNFLAILSLLFLLYLSGCSTIPTSKEITSQQSVDHNQRVIQLAKLNQWQITGKIAFIQEKDRQSANVHWQFNEADKQQSLKLTTYLGIQVLSLESNNNVHIVEVDGNKYQSDDLQELIYSLTGLTLPTQALSSWLKATVHLQSDKIEFNSITKLPETINSIYNDKKWAINYSSYKQFNHYQLPTKLTIKQDNLVIKLNIHRWNV